MTKRKPKPIKTKPPVSDSKDLLASVDYVTEPRATGK